MKHILTILMVSMFASCFSQSLEIEKHLTKKSNIIIDTTDMLGYNVKVVNDKKGNRLYVEHTIDNKTRFVLYKDNVQYKHGLIITDNQLVIADPHVTVDNNKAGE
jgi:hypothetical protein